MNNFKKNFEKANLMEQNNKNKRIFRYLPLVASACLISNCSHNPKGEYFNYYNYKVNGVYQNYLQLNSNKSINKNFTSSDNFYERLALVRQIIKSMEKSIIRLSNSNKEIGGYLAINEESTYILVFVNGQVDALLKYLQEFLNNNFTHLDDFVRIYNENRLLKDIFEVYFGIGEKKIADLVNDISENRSADNVRNIIEKLLLCVRYNYPWFLENENNADEGMTSISRFYVRAKNDQENKPLLSDLANSNAMGDLLLITNSNNIVKVFYITEGKSTIVYERNLNETESNL
ncbi:MAG: hypothetical protein QW076_02585 [Candidatus Anstonellales archaeon]